MNKLTLVLALVAMIAWAIVVLVTLIRHERDETDKLKNDVTQAEFKDEQRKIVEIQAQATKEENAPQTPQQTVDFFNHRNP